MPVNANRLDHVIGPTKLANAPIDGIMQLTPAFSLNLGKQLPLFSL